MPRRALNGKNPFDLPPNTILLLRPQRSPARGHADVEAEREDKGEPCRRRRSTDGAAGRKIFFFHLPSGRSSAADGRAGCSIVFASGSTPVECRASSLAGKACCARSA